MKDSGWRLVSFLSRSIMNVIAGVALGNAVGYPIGFAVYVALTYLGDIAKQAVTLSSSIEQRLCVPMTPSELAATFELPIRTVRATLYQLRRQKRVERLDKTMPVETKQGRKDEFLWQRAYYGELL